MEELFFKVNAELKSIVGRDLINNDAIAIIELVKNAYDAQSPSVDIEFSDLAEEILPESKIVIQDFGHGMDLDALKSKWLNIAYSEKKETPFVGNRVQAGNKGVGRFSCDRLGGQLDMYTRTADGNYIHLEVLWDKFEDADIDTEVTSIPVQFKEYHPAQFEKSFSIRPFHSGTRLEISKVHKLWNREKLIDLKRNLEKFANPNQGFQADTFKINLACPDFLALDRRDSNPLNHLNGPIINTVFEKLEFKTSYIESTIENEIITTSLYHRGARLFTLKEINQFSHLKKAKIILYFLNQYHKAYFNKMTGMPSIEYGSVFLFLNGFRVPPYGDRGNDWLQLDSKKTQGTYRALGCREVLGRIEVQGSNDEWKMVSSREGVANTAAYKELVSHQNGYFYKVLKKLEKYVVNGISWDSTDTKWAEITGKLVEASSKNNSVQEQYRLSESVKEKQLIGNLKSIILLRTKTSDILSIDFDPSILRMLQKQDEKAAKEFFNEFETIAEKIDTAPTGNIKKFLLEAAQELKKEKIEANKAKNLAEKERKLRQETTKKLEEEKKKVKAAEKAKNIAVEQQKVAVKQKQDAEGIATIKEEENLFLKATRNKDVDDIIDLHHQVLTWSGIIEKDLDWLLQSCAAGEEIPADELLSTLQRIKAQNNKIFKVAEFATKANFKVSAQITTANIITFIRDYISELSSNELVNIKLSTVVPQNCSFITSYKPLELTILLDNLISNSTKANATEFRITISTCNSSTLKIRFDDNGKGLSDSISDPNLIFNRGVTTTEGSGVGLHFAQTTARIMKGRFSIIESTLGGFALELEIKK